MYSLPDDPGKSHLLELTWKRLALTQWQLGGVVCRRLGGSRDVLWSPKCHQVGVDKRAGGWNRGERWGERRGRTALPLEGACIARD